jgi:hypothetical protein
MWWWWVFTFIHNCAWIFWFIARNEKIPKMSFSGQLNMFFGKIISCTCDLNFKLDILILLNINFWSNGLKMNPLPYNLFLQNFKTLKFLYNLIFDQVHLMNMYFHRRGHGFVAHKIWNHLYDFMHSFWFLFFKSAIYTFDIVNLLDSK